MANGTIQNEVCYSTANIANFPHAEGITNISGALTRVGHVVFGDLAFKNNTDHALSTIEDIFTSGFPIPLTEMNQQASIMGSDGTSDGTTTVLRIRSNGALTAWYSRPIDIGDIVLVTIMYFAS